MTLHVTWSQGFAGSAIIAGILGTALLYRFSDSQSAPMGLGSAPDMYARIARRLPKVKAGFLLLMLSFLLQGASLAASL